MSKVKKTVRQVAKQISKNQGSTIVEAMDKMNLFETIKDCANKDNLDEALIPVMISLGFVRGGTTEFFALAYFFDNLITGLASCSIEICRRRLLDGSSEIWKGYTVKQRATLLCKFVAKFVESAIEN